MKIVLVTYGSRGDVQPMLALSLALMAAGHEVLLAAPPEKAAWASQLGCPFAPLGSDLTAFLDGMPDAHSLSSAFGFIRKMRAELKAQFDDLPPTIHGADLVVGASLAFALPTVAESMGIDYRYVAFAPQILPSRHHPYLIFQHHNWPAWFNRLTWFAARQINRCDIQHLINKKRKQIGLEPVGNVWSHIMGPHLIVASDPSVAGLPADANQPCSQTGYWHLDQPPVEDKALKRFLAAGSRPVYAGFGSMPKSDQARLVPLLASAARTAGRRLVIAKFWPEAAEIPPADDLFYIHRYPHLDLFPRMAAVIHHGGAGTTATAARSGVPQIIVPHILDQYYWGHQIYQAGLGPRAIWRRKLTAAGLAEAIQECLHSDAMRRKAVEVADTIGGTNSIETGIRALVGAEQA